MQVLIFTISYLKNKSGFVLTHVVFLLFCLSACCKKDAYICDEQNPFTYYGDSIKIKGQGAGFPTFIGDYPIDLNHDSINDVFFRFTRTWAYTPPPGMPNYFDWKIEINSSRANVYVSVGEVHDSLSHEGEYLSLFNIIDETTGFNSGCLIFENHFYEIQNGVYYSDFQTPLIAIKIDEEGGSIFGWIRLTGYIVDHGSTAWFYIQDYALSNCLNHSIQIAEVE